MKLFFFAVLFPLLAVRAQSNFNAKVVEGAKHLACSPPDERNPVSLNAQLINEGDSIAIIVKVSMAPGWHIYAYVPPTLPYIAIDEILLLPQNVRAVGEWIKTEPEASSNDPGVLIYENEAVFIHKAAKFSPLKAGDIIKAGLYYQTCNLRQCLPPKEKTFELQY